MLPEIRDLEAESQRAVSGLWAGPPGWVIVLLAVGFGNASPL